ncbi:dihydrofolate reductase-like domain-containing protein [Mycena floridula]|nr:dihydrofolate reductase-like domain-containing protein [Mycena floridula]
MSRLTLIVAATKSNGIGQQGRLPWRLPKEMSYFAKVTSTAPEGQSNAVIMGRNTWQSIPKKFRPLPKRVNLVLSRDKSYSSGELTPVLGDLDAAVNFLTNNIHRTFIIGGAALYSEALSQEMVDRVLMTRIISPDFNECDTFMPEFLGERSGWVQANHAELVEWAGFDVPEGLQEENDVQYEFQMWVRK